MDKPKIPKELIICVTDGSSHLWQTYLQSLKSSLCRIVSRTEFHLLPCVMNLPESIYQRSTESVSSLLCLTDALLAGDPTVDKVHYNGRLIDITPLFHARKEAEMVGELLGIEPLLGSRATKQAVLQAIPSVSLIHLAAHGNAERGEIALSPQCTTNSTPQEEDYLLTMSDIEGVQVRAKLVVLSCCHSGRGLVKKEGVLGIARAFLASGARSVLVASWALEDEATAKLMKHFYKHLVGGESASESLHQAVQWLRSNGFPKPSQWAPFVLMGDNVTFDFMKKGKSGYNEQFFIINQYHKYT